MCAIAAPHAPSSCNDPGDSSGRPSIAMALTPAEHQHLDVNGYVVLKSLMPPALCRRACAVTDALVGPPAAQTQRLPLYVGPRQTDPLRAFGDVEAALDARSPITVSTGDYKHLLWHPFFDSAAVVAAELVAPLVNANRELLLGGGDGTDRRQRLRLGQQLIMRTDPSPPPYAAPVRTPEAPTWHTDFHVIYPFDTPFFHCLTALAPIAAGQAAFTIVPGSAKLALAWLAGMSAEGIQRMRDDVGFRESQQRSFVATVDRSRAVEIEMDEGDVIIFSLLSVHSGSESSNGLSRHALFTTFFVEGTQRIISQQKATGIWSPPSKFPLTFRSALRKLDLESLLDWEPVVPRNDGADRHGARL